MYRIRYAATPLILICFLAASAQAAQISVEPVYQEVFQGENVTVNITVYPEEGVVYGGSYTLYFNNTLLNATSLTQGPFLTQDGNSSTVWVDEINNTLGKVEYAESRMGTDDGVNDSGVLTTIVFKAIGVEGISPLNITDLAGGLLVNSTSGPIPTNVNKGRVEVIKEVGGGICGDVDGILPPGVTMNDGRQIFMNIIYGSANYPISDSWAADCDGLCDGMTMNDGRQIFMNIIYGPEEYPLECCGICGDVDEITGVTMDDGRQIFMNIIYGSANYPISDSWAADCDGLCDGMTMNDGRQIFMNILYGPEEYPLECC